MLFGVKVQSVVQVLQTQISESKWKEIVLMKNKPKQPLSPSKKKLDI